MNDRNVVRAFLVIGCVVVLSIGSTAVLPPVSGALKLAQSRDELLQEFKERRQDEMNRRTETFHQYVQDRSEAYRRFYEKRKKAFERFKKRVAEQWGTERVSVSTKKSLTEYRSDLSRRYIVDFERGRARAEVLLPVELAEDNRGIVRERLRNQLVRMVTDRKLQDEIGAVQQSGDTRPDGISIKLDQPVLAGQVRTDAGETVTGENADTYARRIVKRKDPEVKRVEGEDGQQRVKASVTIKLIPKHTRKRARQYLPTVRQFANRFKLDPALVLAVIHTESSFNPKARSPAPAYGLMQLVPSTGGMAAYRHIHDEERLLKPAYLYQPRNNIELGSGYLNLLILDYFSSISDSVSREYCGIAAYNTGPGNLARALVDEIDISRAVSVVNRMTHREVYSLLQQNLPAAETKSYLRKVRTRQRQYQRWLKRQSEKNSRSDGFF